MLHAEIRGRQGDLKEKLNLHVFFIINFNAGLAASGGVRDIELQNHG